MVPSASSADALIDDVREAVVLPRHLVLARQLHAHRLADGLRQQRRVVRHGVGAVDAVAARAAREDRRARSPAAGRAASPTPLRVGYADCVGDQIVALLALHVRDGARRADRPVHLVRMQVRRLHAPSRACASVVVDVPRVDEQRVARRLLVAQVVVERRAGAAGRRPASTSPSACSRRLHRLPRLLGDDADEVLLDDDLHDARAGPRTELSSTLDERRADRRRPHDAAVQHAGHAHVVHELELRRSPSPACRRAAPACRARSTRSAASASRVALEREVERLPADELAVARPASTRSACDADDAVRDDELIGRHAEPRRTPAAAAPRARSRRPAPGCAR